MAETDPFGRDKSEDPLAEMGWASGGTAQPEPVPTEVHQPEQTGIGVEREERRENVAAQSGQYRPAPSGIPGQRKRRRNGCGCAITGALLVVVATVIVIASLVADGIEAIDDAIPTIPSRPSEAGGPERRDRKAERPPNGLDQASLLRRGNLAPALRRLRRVTKSSQVRLLRIDAQRIVVQTATANGGTKLAQATWDGEVSLLSTSPGGGGTTFAWSRVDASAPNRVVRAATRGRKAASFDYLVLIDAAGLRWSAFLKNGRGTFQAQPDGRDVNKIG